MKRYSVRHILISLIVISAIGPAFCQVNLPPNAAPADSNQSKSPTIIREDSTKTTIRKSQPKNPSTSADTANAYISHNRWPTGALLRSTIIPGWGQIYNHQYIKAVIYGGTEIALIATTRKYWREMNAHQHNFLYSNDQLYKFNEFRLYENSRDNRNLYLWLTGLTMLVSMFDAFVDAHLANFNQTDKAFDVQVIPQDNRLQLSMVFNFK